MARVQLTQRLRADYLRLFDSCLVSPKKAARVEAAVDRLESNEDRYSAVGDPLGIPWGFIAVIHQMESSDVR